MHEDKGNRVQQDGAPAGSGMERERRQVQEILEDWAELFLLAQQLERAAGRTQRPLFHKEPGQQPVFIPGRAIIWPLEFEPLWHLRLLRLAKVGATSG